LNNTSLNYIGNFIKGVYMAIDVSQIKKLREETQAGISDCRQALEDTNGDYKKAKVLLVERGIEKAQKKASREAGDGIITSYVHSTGKVGVLVELRCETDFVARTDDFKSLGKEIAMQITAMKPKDVKELLSMAYIRDGSLTVEQLIKKEIAKLGENIQLTRFTRMELGIA
jgi:elongation factor Ts